MLFGRADSDDRFLQLGFYVFVSDQIPHVVQIGPATMRIRHLIVVISERCDKALLWM
ncbi:hypothetical protein SIL81_03790 [Xanthomonas campestris pv. incanae]|nr:hypothetical protein [Xanthomonas campestris]MDX6081467.1 hypothetical protein [Xanthomonas campestris pv. incanae]MDX6084529.1 hypothetical protein [Xanthomonas campestris pv. incanae]MDX6138350.1 hypothetical protein [Xanthomonas campestris pv. incanae]